VNADLHIGTALFFAASSTPLNAYNPCLHLKHILMLSKIFRWLRTRFVGNHKKAKTGFKGDNPFLIL
jgi:hypothetical protein